MRPVFHFRRVTVLTCEAHGVMATTWRRGAGLRQETESRNGWLAGELGEAEWLARTATAFQALAVPRGPVVLVLPAERTLTKMLALPRAAPAQWDKIIRFELAQSLPMPLSEVIWGRARVGRGEDDTLATLVAVRLSLVEALCAAGQAAGFSVQAVWPTQLAQLAAFRGAVPGPVSPCLVLIPGETATTLWQLEGGRAALRVVLGGAGSRPIPVVAEALAREITRTSQAFQQQYGLAKPGQIYWAGVDHGLSELLATRCQLPLVEWSLPAWVEACAQGSPDLTSAGAAAMSLLEQQMVVDLLPPARRAQQHRRQQRPWLVAAAIVAVAALLLPLIEAHREWTQLQGRISALEQELRPVRARAQQAQAVGVQLAAARRELGLWRELENGRTSWGRLLADWQERLAAAGDAWIEQVRLVPDATGRAPRLAVAGCLLDKNNSSVAGSTTGLPGLRRLRTNFIESPFIASLVAERYDTSQPGWLRFDWVFLTDSRHPL